MAEAAMDFVDDSLDAGAEVRSSGEQTSEEEDAQATLLVFYPSRQAVPYKLHLGANVVGRQSSLAQRDANRLHQWAAEYTDTAVHGIFLESTSISSSHAVFYVENFGDACFVKDLGSRNKTFLKRGGKHNAVTPHVKHSLQNQDTLTFGALRCRVSFGPSGTSEGSLLDSGASPPTIRTTSPPGNPFQTPSTAMSIGQRTIPPGSIPGAPGSLDKCPSLQEWFQHPRRVISAGRQQGEPFSLGARSRQRSEDGSGEGEFPSKVSFGFGNTIHEGVEPGGEVTSDPEPETPRIDRPASFASPLRKTTWNQSPFAGSTLDRMEEDDEPQEEAPKIFPEATQADQPMGSGDGRSSLEMGAETLTQLRTTPVKGTLAGELAALQDQDPASQPGTPGTDDLSSERPQSSPLRNHNPPSPFSPEVCSPIGSPTSVGTLGEGDLNLRQGRPIRLQQKSPTPKRSRSGRIASPEKSQPRSKSPRLQRGFQVPSSKKEGFVVDTGEGDQHMRLDSIRDAVHDIWSGM